MKAVIYAALLVAALPAFASNGIGSVDQAPTCFITKIDGTSVEMKRLPDAAVSTSMNEDIALGGSNPRTKNSFRYSSRGVQIELSESAGCALECWAWRHVLVSVGGVPFYTVGSKDTLIDRYPEVVIHDSTGAALVTCILPNTQI